MSRPPLPCPESIAPLLGTLPDPMIAAQAHVSTATVRRWREERQIPPCRERGAPRSAMTPATTRKRLDALRERLGGLTWAHLAARCGVSRQAVSQARKIGATVPTLRAWERQAAISHRLAHVGPLVYEMPDEVAPLLGVLTDTEIGKRYEVPRQVVARWRVAANLPAVPRAGRPLVGRLDPEATRARLDVLAWRHGCSTWAALGRALGVGRQSVPAALSRGLTEATLARWDEVPVRAAESDGPQILSASLLTR